MAKSLSDALTAVGHPLSLIDFNLYVFRGLQLEIKDLITTLNARAEQVSFTKLHSLLLSPKFLHGEKNGLSDTKLGYENIIERKISFYIFIKYCYSHIYKD